MYSYQSIGLFIGKDYIDELEHACDEIGITKECFLETFIRDLVNGLGSEGPKVREEYAARNYYMLQKENIEFYRKLDFEKKG